MLKQPKYQLSIISVHAINKPTATHIKQRAALKYVMMHIVICNSTYIRAGSFNAI